MKITFEVDITSTEAVASAINALNRFTAPVPKVAPKKKSPTHTHDSIKATCLELSRKDPKNKHIVKTILISHGAQRVSDLEFDKFDKVVKELANV